MLTTLYRDYTTGFSTFSVDTVAEIDKLPTVTGKGQDNLHTVYSCCAGSRAVVTSTSETYILNGDQNKWIKTISSGGSGGSGFDNWATNEDIDKMFES